MKRLFVNFMTFAAMATALTLAACSSDSDGEGNGNGNGGNGETLLVVDKARRLEGQQIIDGDVVVPAACKMVMLWLDVTVSCLVRQCVYLS